MEGTAANQYTSYLVNRFPFQGFAKDDFAYKNLKDSIGSLNLFSIDQLIYQLIEEFMNLR